MSTVSHSMLHTSPTRYKQVVVDGEDKEFERLHQLLLDCVRYPDVAAEVRTLVFRKRRYADVAGKNEADIPDHVWAQSPFSSVLDALRLDDSKSSWLKALTRWEEPQDGGDDTQGPARLRYASGFAEHATITLLVLCPNIEHFAYTTGASGKLDDFLHRNNYGRLPTQYLQRLQHVSVLPQRHTRFGDTYSACDPLHLLLSFHRLPAIQSFSLRTVEDADEIGIAFPGTSDLRAIQVEHSALSTVAMAALIRVPRSLEKFVLTGGTLEKHERTFFPRTIAKALWSQRTTLMELDFDCDRNGFYVPYDPKEEDARIDDGNERTGKLMQNEEFKLDEASGNGPLFTRHLPDTRKYEGTIGSLHDFVSLKRLRIGMYFLLGRGPRLLAPFRLVDALPQSLEVLELRGYTRGKVAHWDEQIEEFLKLKATKLPNLKVVLGIEERITSNMDIPESKPWDLRHPKRALTAYFLYMQDTKPVVGQQHPDWTRSQISEEAERTWSALSKERRDLYEHRHEIDLARYCKQVDEYNAGRPVPEITVEEAEILYEEHLATGVLIKGRKGLRVLQRAVASGRQVSADIDAVEQRLLEADQRQKQEAEEHRLRVQGPDFGWVLSEQGSSGPDGIVSDKTLEREPVQTGANTRTEARDHAAKGKTPGQSTDGTSRDEL